MKIKEYLTKQREQRACDLDSTKKRLDELDEINKTADNEDDLKKVADEIDQLKAKKAELEQEIKDIDEQLAQLDKPADNTADDTADNAERKKFLNFEQRGYNKMNIEERKARAEKFSKENRANITEEELRAVLVSGGNIATPTEVEGINDTFNKVSSIVDLVKVVDCEGMGANKVAYEKTIGTASDHTEGEEIGEGAPTFGFVEIKPESVGVVSYISKQVKRQTPLDYEGKVRDSAFKALRVKAGKMITDAITASDLVEKPADLAIKAVDDKTLRRIALSYGGDENVDGNAVLFLNKKDLIAFGDIRGTNKQAVYEITPDADNPNTGVIKDGGLAVKYCLNNNLPSLADLAESTKTGGVAMFYGHPENCELDLFSGYEISVSEDFKFTSNLLTIKGDFEAGAAVVKEGGFVAVTLGA